MSVLAFHAFAPAGTAPALVRVWPRSLYERPGLLDAQVAFATARCMRVDIAAKVLGVDPRATLPELRSAFRARAKVVHPDGGGSADAFQELRKAYAFLRRSWAHSAPELPAARARLEKEWEEWEEEVRRFRALASEGDVIYWRPEATEAWRVAVVLAVQVVEEPASGPHGWIYLQTLVQDEHRGGHVYFMDETAEMDQVEPLSPDGVNWCFAPSVEALNDGT
eukprot:CAMPEP_0117540726 /NCGR_PEP_ID=MMETSP0784-20121206/43647_1 /TAXON_ID=39447 /ORGANISM="" /LENGTH=221 /DNA_ID=CAMNT_0005337389 /DNA_START=109 /DNA_END=770 /DNA_ORIENTATION=+